MKLKEQIRKAARQTLAALSAEQRMRKSEAIAARLRTETPFDPSKPFMTYVSTDFEVNTHGLIADALRDGTAVYVPRINGEHLTWHRLGTFRELEPGSHGILQPCAQSPAEKELLQLPILVPLLAFDQHCQRLGQGGGHFDRTFAEHTGIRIGLAFDCQQVLAVPVESHDVGLAWVVTEARTHIQQ